MLAALLAFALQAFVVQTHIHALGAPVHVAHAESDSGAHPAAATAHATVADQRSVCMVCQALAQHTSLVATDSIAALAHAIARTAARAIRLAPRAITHSWQGRAPPFHL